MSTDDKRKPQDARSGSGKQVRKGKSKSPRKSVSVDRRTPSGRVLPY